LKIALALPLTLGLAGCGGEGPYTGGLYPVSGRVVLADGGPLVGGSVQFIPKLGGLPATGTVGPDGAFALRSHKARDEGAAPGEYKVRIEPSSEYLVRKGRKSKKLPFAAKYRDYDGETGLTATIKPEPTELPPFRLDAP
jgi:hypothetical protein